MSVQQEKFKEIADAIRDKTGSEDLIKPSEFAAKVNDVYEEGKKMQEQEFWDDYLDTTNFICAFAGYRWNTDNFKPNKDLVPTNSNRMFHFNIISDLESHFNNIGIKLDTSNCTSISYMFLNSGNKIIPPISLESASDCSNLFAYSSIETIRKIIFSEKNAIYTNAFKSCSKLTNLEAEGIIPQNISFSDCPLSKASITSIINALSDSTTDKTVTFSQAAKESAFTDEEWNTLINTKLNWTFSLV